MVIDELRELCAGYEHALINNDVPALEAYFWESADTMRLGATENLFGSEEIVEFRRNRPAVGLQREVDRIDYIVMDDNHGVVNVCFHKLVKGVERHGRQTQVWKRFPDLGWKIVAAHVSFMEL